LLDNIIARLMKMLTLLGYLIEEEGNVYIADMDADDPLASLQAASCTYHIALGPRAGQKVLSLRTVAGRAEKETQALCAAAHGFSLHAGVRCGTHQRKELERLCRYITRPAIANERLKRDGAVMSCCNSRARGATAPRTSGCRRWNSCSAWPRWCRARACI
jgi:Putative transposase